ncbi:MAG: prepilin-type N-terminal cleavage/methylation domain-containing protein [Candidatus Omnitrophota bacterium]|nr:prepilin-type N-terminal cleavage/methylation domain-containing protein [Candidatus Omnitrophota bacterium]
MTFNKKEFRGFTLIELILGLSIFALVALNVYSIYTGGIRLSRRADTQNTMFREARMALDLMAFDLENMIPYDFSNSYPQQTAFRGEENKITFLMATSDGLNVVSYFLVVPEKVSIHRVIIGKRTSKNVRISNVTQQGLRLESLVRKEQSLISYLNGEDNESLTELIAVNVKEGSLKFSFAYLKDEESQEAIWKDAWGLNYIPSRIRLKIDFVNPSDLNTIPFTKEILVPHGFWGADESGASSA